LQGLGYICSAQHQSWDGQRNVYFNWRYCSIAEMGNEILYKIDSGLLNKPEIDNTGGTL
jgi:hypothetical protein